MLPADLRRDLDRYHRAVSATDRLIERDTTPHDKSPAEIRARATMRLERMGRFLDMLGQPQRRVPVIHVTGTSGKGSTSTAIAQILLAAGLSVGLHTSPYLQTASEKIQFDGQQIAPAAFADLVDVILGAHDQWRAAGNDALTYGEIWTAMHAVAFAEARVDVAVIEVGAGGRFDLTNTVQPVVSVITSVGIDHIVTLGNTIEEIAWHKAGIIKPGAPVITAVTDPRALPAITTEATRHNVSIIQIEEGDTWERSGDATITNGWRELGADGAGSVFPAPPGGYQPGNAAVAVAAVRAFAAARGMTVGDDVIEDGLAHTRIPGRFERIPPALTGEDGPAILLDGAHNPQKVAALMNDIATLRSGGGELVVVLGALEAKQIAEMTRLITPWANGIVATSPQVLAKAGADAEHLTATIRSAGFTGPVEAIADPRAAVRRAIARAAGASATVLVTGSLYLVGNIRGLWYPDDAIALAQTAWPDPATWPRQWFMTG